MKQISAADAAKLLGVTDKRIRVLCNQGRIVGAKLISGVWILPANPIVKKGNRYRPSKIVMMD
jgi:predicted site-specific integrase-resolvase